MIHHLSIAAQNPKHVAHVLAELFQGSAVPFPDMKYPNSFVALAFDTCGTTVDVHPFPTELIPGTEKDTMFQRQESSGASPYTATHAAISVPASEQQIQAIATREGWRMRHRSGFFEVIELWIENHVLIELLPPTIVPGYLTFMEPATLKRFFADKTTSLEQP